MHKYLDKSNPCSEDYPGPAPFSEPETEALRDLVKKNKDKIKFIYNFNSRGGQYLWPYNGEFIDDLEKSQKVVAEEL